VTDARESRGGELLGGELSERDFHRFRELIYRHAGIRIPETKRVLIANRVRRRLRATGIASFNEYYAQLTGPKGSVELTQFLDAITTNETYFDRDPAQYAWFQQTFLPEVGEAGRSGRRPRRLRVWSAACSTGEELYSIAMRVHEERARFPGWEIYLLGTDLSSEALEAARAGSYDARAVRLISPERRARAFDHDPATQRYRVKAEIRGLATWKSHNLLKPSPEKPFDCIFLKNVLIYFDTASKQTVVRNLIRVLAPGGYLVAGLTEGVSALLDPLIRIKPWLYRKPETGPQESPHAQAKV
jgi:chemotaxis protein methyltransferase CheR